MEPPCKRRRVSEDTHPEEALEARRAQNDLKLKSAFESIFVKYGKDFTGVGDEIDLKTGRIIVDRGHIHRMQNETDPGREEDLYDELDFDSNNDPAQVGMRTKQGYSKAHTKHINTGYRFKRPISQQQYDDETDSLLGERDDELSTTLVASSDDVASDSFNSRKKNRLLSSEERINGQVEYEFTALAQQRQERGNHTSLYHDGITNFRHMAPLLQRVSVSEKDISPFPNPCSLKKNRSTLIKNHSKGMSLHRLDNVEAFHGGPPENSFQRLQESRASPTSSKTFKEKRAQVFESDNPRLLQPQPFTNKKGLTDENGKQKSLKTIDSPNKIWKMSMDKSQQGKELLPGCFTLTQLRTPSKNQKEKPSRTRETLAQEKPHASNPCKTTGKSGVNYLDQTGSRRCGKSKRQASFNACHLPTRYKGLKTSSNGKIDETYNHQPVIDHHDSQDETAQGADGQPKSPLNINVLLPKCETSQDMFDSLPASPLARISNVKSRLNHSALPSHRLMDLSNTSKATPKSSPLKRYNNLSDDELSLPVKTIGSPASTLSTPSLLKSLHHPTPLPHKYRKRKSA